MDGSRVHFRMMALYAFRFCGRWMDGWMRMALCARAGCEKSSTRLELMRCGARKSKVASNTSNTPLAFCREISRH